MALAMSKILRVIFPCVILHGPDQPQTRESAWLTTSGEEKAKPVLPAPVSRMPTNPKISSQTHHGKGLDCLCIVAGAAQVFQRHTRAAVR